MIAFPSCKINLGLNILSKRSDGYHNLETVFYPLPFYDVLEILSNDKDETIFASSGRKIDGSIEDNLCMKAYQLLRSDFPSLPPVQMHLYKNIPIGAGLGGGSADAAFTLHLLNRKFSLNISVEKLQEYAGRLGSDCAFFIRNTPCIGTGKGELLKPIKLNLSTYKIVLINPGIHIPTSLAFSKLTPLMPKKKIEEILQQPIESWAEELFNDFEVVIFQEYTEIKKIKDILYQSGAIYASMSGSGSTVYGIFNKENQFRLSFPSNYFVHILGGHA